MTVPGFTAEASLGRPSRSYRGRAAASGGGVLPSGLDDYSDDGDEGDEEIIDDNGEDDEDDEG